MAFENGLGMAGFSVKGRSEMGRMGSNYLKCDCVEYALHQGAQQVTHSLTFGKVGFANRTSALGLLRLYVVSGKSLVPRGLQL